MPPEPPPPATARRVYLLTHPRTTCHLLERMLSDQPNASHASHFFLGPARKHQKQLLGKGPLEATTESDRDKLFREWQEAFNRLHDHVARAEAEVRRCSLSVSQRNA